MTFSGTIQTAFPEQKGTSANGKQWRRRDYVLLYDNSNAQYPKTVLFSVLGDKIDTLNLQQGVEYDVEIDFTTRDYNGKTYMSASAWKATPKAQGDAQPQYPAPPVVQTQPAPPAPPAQDNDLPF